MKEFQSSVSWKKFRESTKIVCKNIQNVITLQYFIQFFLYSLIKKIFRQINSLVISLVKTILSRIFGQTKMHFLCRRKFTPTHTSKIFVKSICRMTLYLLSLA